ncbi:DUF401 family protein [Thermodesulfobacteriota bacterium]
MENKIPVLFIIIIIFTAILLLNRLGLHLSLSLLAGSIGLGLLMGVPPSDLLFSLYDSITDHQTISLAIIVWLIMLMSGIMEKSGHMKRLVNSFACLAKDARIVGTVMSSLIGLLPMPGGALFSAPMVEESLSKIPATPENKTALNYWFRHIWEFWWPIYPGVILAIALLDIDAWLYMAVMAPMTLLSIFAGIFFILKPMEKSDRKTEGHFSWPGISAFVYEMLPILIIIFSIAFITGVEKILTEIFIDIKLPNLAPVIIGLVASILWVCYVNKIAPSGLITATFGKSNLIMILLIISIMLFKGVMADSGAVMDIRNELMTYGIPVILLILILPFFSGFILGIAVGFVGTSFPLIIPLFPADDMFTYVSYAALAYTFGYMGMMLSPVHLCFMVTRDFFKAGIGGSYSYIIKTSFSVMSAALLLFLFSRLLLGLFY